MKITIETSNDEETSLVMDAIAKLRQQVPKDLTHKGVGEGDEGLQEWRILELWEKRQEGDEVWDDETQSWDKEWIDTTQKVTSMKCRRRITSPAKP